jgi:peroxiredoxin
MMDEAPAELRDAIVVGVDGQPVRVSTLWARRPAVLVLLRHFGCIFCKEQAAQFSAIGDEIEALGATLAFIGSGSPQYAQWFQEDYAPRWPVFSDSNLVTYRALHARRGWYTSINPLTWLLSVRAFLRGFRQTGTMGDRSQQGAVCIVMPDGRMPYRHVSRVAGDHPKPAAVLRALREARAAQ